MKKMFLIVLLSLVFLCPGFVHVSKVQESGEWVEIDPGLIELNGLGRASFLSAASQKYKLIDLGTLGGAASEAYALNDKGQVVGSAKAPTGSYKACFWENGQIKDMNVAEYFSCAYGINNNGRAVGYGTNSTWNYYNVFLWENGALSFLGNLGYVWDINDSGQIVGSFGLWENGVITNLGSLGGNETEGRSINNKSQIVGRADVHSNPSVYVPHAFFWENGFIEDLGTLTGGNSSTATCINENGQVVGGSDSGQSSFPHAVLWEDSQIQDLGTLGGEASGANSINDHGVIVGVSYMTSGDDHAFIWDTTNGIQDLNDLIAADKEWTLITATAINNSGQIAGYGKVDLNGDGTLDEKHAFLLTPLYGVMMDIQPGDDLNYVNPQSVGFVWVAILTTIDFDATTVDGTTVTFGRTGNEAFPKCCCRKDVNNDGDRDFFMKFRIMDTGLQCGDTMAILKGMTLSGQGFQVSDAVDTSVCEVIWKLEEAKDKLLKLNIKMFISRSARRTLRQKLNQALYYIKGDNYPDALYILERVVLLRMDGCALRGEPDKESSGYRIDWLKKCEAQACVYPLFREAADLLKNFI